MQNRPVRRKSFSPIDTPKQKQKHMIPLNKDTVRGAIVATMLASSALNAHATIHEWYNPNFSFVYHAEDAGSNRWDISSWQGAGYTPSYLYSKTDSQYEDWGNEKRTDGWSNGC